MSDFKFLSYHTEYSCTGDVQREMGSAACFAYVFRNIEKTKKQSVNYIIRVYRELGAVKRNQWNNGCLLSKKEIRNHLDLLKGIIPFEAKIVSKERNGLKFFEIHLKVENAKGTCHKFILTWIRYLYEFPYNMYLIEANRLRKEKLFMFDSIANLFNLVGGCFGLGGGHSIAAGRTIGFLQRKELSAKINRVQSLNSIYQCSYDGASLRAYDVPYKGHNLSYHDLEFWRNEELFQKRLPVYQEKYKKIKRNK